MEKNKKASFLKIHCPRCKNASIVYGKSSSNTKCLKCNYLLVKTAGGKAKIRAPIREVLC